uniref:Uncharacterized protein n=1 Tax=Arundo donax TaxID=35708 RepID=A0A0A9T6Q3_ARUDO
MYFKSSRPPKHESKKVIFLTEITLQLGLLPSKRLQKV